MNIDKKALLLDMNGTFMFGGDHFGPDEDFARYYRSQGGGLADDCVNNLIRDAYAYLEQRYPLAAYRHCFPSVAEAIGAVCSFQLPFQELEDLVSTFVHHELGHIPPEYAKAVEFLGRHYALAAVVDIWAPKAAWLQAFEGAGLGHLFRAMSFSSDHGMVKPSPEPFCQVLKALGVDARDALVIGDSPRRDLGGAVAAGIDCVLVGGACDPRALECCPNLVAFACGLGWRP